MKIKLTSIFLFGILTAGSAQAAVIGFDDLSLASESFFDPNITTTFVSGGATFEHNAPFGECCWDGFTYSNTTDTTTPGLPNQYSAITGGGVNGSANYGVSFFDSRILFDSATTVAGGYFSNSTYAYYAMRDGNDGNDPAFVKGPFTVDDFFTLTVTGLDAAQQALGSVDIALATGTSIVDSWIWADLSSLGQVSELNFSLSSSDVGLFGMNTPAYFVMDDLTTVPVPAAVWLFGSGLLGLLGLARRRHR